MRRLVTPIFLAILVTLVGYRPAHAAVPLATRLSGRILIQTQSGGALWYVSPLDHKRYYIGTQAAADKVVAKMSLTVSAANMATLPEASSTARGNFALRQRLSGRILRQSGTSTLWYISPVTLRRVMITSPSLPMLRKQGLGISDANVKLIPVAAGYGAPVTPPKPVNGLLRTQKTVTTSRGTFVVDIMTLDISMSTYKVMVDTAENTDCRDGCVTLPLKTLVDRRRAVAGMHGTYFCPIDYAACAGRVGSYDFPVFNSYTKAMINSDRIKYTSQPMVAIDTTNRPFLYRQGKDFFTFEEFEAQFRADSLAAGGSGVLRAEISNGPTLMAGGTLVLKSTDMDTKQATVKSYRGFFGWKGNVLTFGVVRAATVTDTAAVAQALGLTDAINLDGGGTTALYHNGGYVLGPGRNLANALLITP